MILNGKKGLTVKISFTQKYSEHLLLFIIGLMYIAMCAEAEIYVPAFPEMVNYFATTEDKIQLILSLNFVGLCIASLISGPLSDTYGRRNVLLLGLSLFFISSCACIFAEDFSTMLIWRFIQGLSASVPMVVSTALFLDKYALEKASQLIGVLNTFITAAMAGAPILGAWLITHFQWRINFIVITFFAAAALIGTYFFIEETLPKHSRKTLNIKQILFDYYTLLSSFKFIGYSLIGLFSFTAIIVYISNLSLIFINHLGVPLEEFGYYQAITMTTFLIFSALGAKLIAQKGIDYTKNLGGFLMIVGSTTLFITALFQPTSIILICASMSFVAAGGALTVGIFGMKALELYPNMKGTASSMLTGIRQLVASLGVFISEFTFNGSILPVAIIIFTYLCIIIVWYAWMQKEMKILATAA